MSRKCFCDENCNECELISCDNYRQLTLILNALHQKIGEGVYEIVQHFCPNLTACAEVKGIEK